MPNVSFEPICSSNLDAVVSLLNERGSTLPDYTRWKYNSQCDNRSHGLIAYLDHKPVGCFGVVPKQFKLPDGSMIECGWLADLYVTPEARGIGLGLEIVNEISNLGEPLWVHPRPKKTHAFYYSNGYHKIDFQSTRRLIIDRKKYVNIGTSYPYKNLIHYCLGLGKSAEEIVKSRNSMPKNDFNGLKSQKIKSNFYIEPENYFRWICEQPVRNGVKRTWDIWSFDGIKIYFMDDLFDNGLRRRRVLYTEGIHRINSATWSKFFKKAKSDNCTILEVFTTDRVLDLIWQRQGALLIDDGPILTNSLLFLQNEVILHGWDRENWTNLSYI